MRTQQELSSFIVLRSNGWSLAKISKHLNIPKTTLFHWEEKNADTIHLLKYVQLEKIQEQYVPSYEEQLKDTHEHLEKIQAALKQHDYSKMSPEFLLQMNFQLQTRLDKIRQQVPLRSPQFGVPLESLPPIGCVTKDEDFPHQGDFSDPDPNVEEDDDVGPDVPAVPNCAVGRGVPAEPSPPVAASHESAADHADAPVSPTDNEPPTTDHSAPDSSHPWRDELHESSSLNQPVNGNGHPNGNGLSRRSSAEADHHRSNGSLRELRDSVVNPITQNGTFRNENPRGSKTDPCKSTTSNNQNGTTVPFRKDLHE